MEPKTVEAPTWREDLAEIERALGADHLIGGELVRFHPEAAQVGILLVIARQLREVLDLAQRIPFLRRS